LGRRLPSGPLAQADLARSSLHACLPFRVRARSTTTAPARRVAAARRQRRTSGVSRALPRRLQVGRIAPPASLAHSSSLFALLSPSLAATVQCPHHRMPRAPPRSLLAPVLLPRSIAHAPRSAWLHPSPCACSCRPPSQGKAQSGRLLRHRHHGCHAQAPWPEPLRLFVSSIFFCFLSALTSRTPRAPRLPWP
jgi:hypothetical protein